MSKTEREMVEEMYKAEPSFHVTGDGHIEAYEKVMDTFNLAVDGAMLSKPKQYDIGIDTFERMKANCTKEEIIGGCKLNIDKYVWRKKGSDKEDLKKAKDYIDLWLWALGE
jgi:hypothetical protein